MSMFNLVISCLTLFNLLWFMRLTFQVSMRYCFYDIKLYFHHQTHPQLSVISALASLFILPGAISHCSLLFSSNILDTIQPRGSHLPVITFCLSYWPHDSPGKNTGVVCHFLLQWIMLCQNSSLWPVHLGWPCMAWLITSLSYAGPFIMKSLWSVPNDIC